MREELISLMETLCGNCIPPFSLFLGGVGEYLWCLLSRGAWLYFKNSIIEVWKRKLQKVMGEKKNPCVWPAFNFWGWPSVPFLSWLQLCCRHQNTFFSSQLWTKHHKIVPNQFFAGTLECSVWADKREHRLYMANPLYFMLFSSVEAPVRNSVPEEFCKLSATRTEQLLHFSDPWLRGYQAIPWKTRHCWAPWSEPQHITIQLCACRMFSSHWHLARFPQSPGCSRFPDCTAGTLECSCLQVQGTLKATERLWRAEAELTSSFTPVKDIEWEKD